MSNRKRFLAFVLTLVMVVSTFATVAVADNGNGNDVEANGNGNDVAAVIAHGSDLAFADVTQDSIQFERALQVLTDLGIVMGFESETTGAITFRGHQAVTRAQFALFVARISTGTPARDADGSLGWFDQASPGAMETLGRIFTDANEIPIWAASAILHCVDEEIIRGRPGPGGTFVFDPNATITFEEAIAMLVRALGHTGLTFPHGYRTRAAEPEVALIGRSVATSGFDFTAQALGADVLRYDMAMLLYNFLLSSQVTTSLVWNPVTGLQQMVPERNPVLRNFGIEAVTGYVTAVENYAMTLNVDAYDGFVPAGVPRAELPLTIQGTAVSRAEMLGGGIDRIPIDIRIGYGAPIVSAATNTLTGWLPSNINTTQEALGLVVPDDVPEFMAKRYWLGRKIIVFRPITAGQRHVTLPSAIVVGSRTLTDNELNTATFQEYTVQGTNALHNWERFVRRVYTFTLDDGTGSPITFTQRVAGTMVGAAGRGQLDTFLNLYSFTMGGQLVSAGLATGANNADLNDMMQQAVGSRDAGATATEAQLAAMAANGGHYELWFVDNGTNARGEREFFFEFVPFRVGVLHARGGGGIYLRHSPLGNLLGVYQLYRAGHPGGLRVIPFFDGTDSAVNNFGMTEAAAVAAARTPFIDQGFVFSVFGAHYRDLVLREQLDANTGIRVTGIHALGAADGTTVFFDSEDIPSATFNLATRSLAVGAIGRMGANPGMAIDNVDHSRAYRFRMGAEFTLFTDSEGNVLLSRETAGPVALPREVDFAVVVSTIAGAPQSRAGAHVAPSPVFAGIGAGMATAVRVVRSGSDAVVDVLLRNVGDGGPNAAQLVPGEYLALRSQGDGTYAWDVVTGRTTLDSLGDAMNSMTGAMARTSTETSDWIDRTEATGRLTRGIGTAVVRPNAYAFEAPAANWAESTRILTAESPVSIARMNDSVEGARTAQVRITADTDIIIFGTVDGSATGEFVARRFSGAQMNQLSGFLTNAARIAVVSERVYTGTGRAAPGVAAAEVLFITTDIDVGRGIAGIPENFAVIVSGTPIRSGDYTIVQAVSLVDGPIDVAVRTHGANVPGRLSGATNVGQFVMLETASRTMMGQTVRVAYSAVHATEGTSATTGIGVHTGWTHPISWATMTVDGLNEAREGVINTPATERAAIRDLVDPDGVSRVRVARNTNSYRYLDRRGTIVDGVFVPSHLQGYHGEGNRFSRIALNPQYIYPRADAAGAGVPQMLNARVWWTGEGDTFTVLAVMYERIVSEADKAIPPTLTVPDASVGQGQSVNVTVGGTATGPITVSAATGITHSFAGNVITFTAAPGAALTTRTITVTRDGLSTAMTLTVTAPEVVIPGLDDLIAEAIDLLSAELVPTANNNLVALGRRWMTDAARHPLVAAVVAARNVLGTELESIEISALQAAINAFIASGATGIGTASFGPATIGPATINPATHHATVPQTINVTIPNAAGAAAAGGTWTMVTTEGATSIPGITLNPASNNETNSLTLSFIVIAAPPGSPAIPANTTIPVTIRTSVVGVDDITVNVPVMERAAVPLTSLPAPETITIQGLDAPDARLDPTISDVAITTVVWEWSTTGGANTWQVVPDEFNFVTDQYARVTFTATPAAGYAWAAMAANSIADVTGTAVTHTEVAAGSTDALVVTVTFTDPVA